MRTCRQVIGILLVLAGIGICFHPVIRAWYLDRQTESVIRTFQEIYDTVGEGEEKIPKEEDPFYQECLKYNRQIYEEGQSRLKDVWSYEQAPVNLDAMLGDCFGYVEIPVMEAKLALYLGASGENLLKGAAVMGQTSLPIGEGNTNCVIAGHRGYYGSPYLREIEKLSIGDVVYVTNPWETLTYRVVEICIIQPDDIDAVKIQEGKDRITLLTCHPYAADTVAKDRYVVYCERDHGAGMDGKTETGSKAGTSSCELE